VITLLCALAIATLPLEAHHLGVELSDRPSAYIDLGPWARAFQKADGSGPAAVDSDGWPTEDAISVLMDDRAVPAWAPPLDDPSHFQPKEDGVYTLQFKGQATISAASGSPVTVGTPQYSASTGKTTASVTLPPGAPNLIILKFASTHRASGGGIADLHLFRPGYGAAKADQVFTDDLFKAIKSFSYLRFMGWLDTNYPSGYYGDLGHHLLSWSSRNLPGQLVDRPGNALHALPWEYVILLANRSHKDVWINVPIAATGASPADENSYVFQLAKLLRDGDAFTGAKGIDPSLHIYIEHSNEVWNYGFSQYIWNKLAAIDEVKQGNSVLNRDGSTDQEQWTRRRHALRLYQIAKIFEKVFGPGSLNQRVRPILAGWTIQPYWYREVLGWMANTFGPPKSYFYGVAETAYFNDQKASKTASPEQVLAAMSADSDAGRANTMKWRTIADEFGLKLCAYEAGPDNGGGDPTNIGNRILANRLPAMKDAVIHNFKDNFFGLGGDMASYFALSSAYSRYGCWGATDDLSNLHTPKFAACLELATMSATAGSRSSGSTAALASPQHVAVQSLGGNQIRVSWSPVSTAATYTVWYSTGGNFLIAAQGITGASFLHTGLTAGANYVYYVTAQAGPIQSSPSQQVSTTARSK
jgi:hypothetical protein